MTQPRTRTASSAGSRGTAMGSRGDRLRSGAVFAVRLVEFHGGDSTHRSPEGGPLRDGGQ
ncbi:hypothetical protein [Streptomyces zaomyceticus]|uniref:hypothetical protein n=1 Tax=Streptomyces zaomyceticus TaxID=68286 RepID=UPI0034382582